MPIRRTRPSGETYAETSTTDRSFTGQTQDTTAGSQGVYDFLLRQQSAAQGRWLAPDPAGLAAVDITNPQTWNRYAYVGNNPLSRIDPLGLCEFSVSQQDPDTGNIYQICLDPSETRDGAQPPPKVTNLSWNFGAPLGQAGKLPPNFFKKGNWQCNKSVNGALVCTPTAPINGKCLGNVNSFVTAHLGDATTLANSLGNGVTPTRKSLAVAGNETGYGGGFAQYGNYFGLHGSGPAGTYHTTGTPSVPVAMFPVSNGFLLSGQVFVGHVSPFMTPGIGSNPLAFFTALNNHGDATGNSGYPAHMVGTGKNRGPFTRRRALAWWATNEKSLRTPPCISR